MCQCQIMRLPSFISPGTAKTRWWRLRLRLELCGLSYEAVNLATTYSLKWQNIPSCVDTTPIVDLSQKPKLINASYPQGETEKNRDTETDTYGSSFCCSVAVVSGGCFSGSSSPWSADASSAATRRSRSRSLRSAIGSDSAAPSLLLLLRFFNSPMMTLNPKP